jgi:hypothetical protein
LWEFETGGQVQSSPAISASGTVYVGSVDKKIYALDGTTGDKLWDFETNGIVVSSPAIGSDGTVYVCSFDSYLYALDGQTGNMMWQPPDGFTTSNARVVTSPAIGPDGLVYFAVRQYFYGYQGCSASEDSPWSMFGQNAQRARQSSLYSFTDDVPLAIAWSEAVEDVDAPGWWRSDWFGDFYGTITGWIYHAEFGWLYLSPGRNDEGIWLWREELGWSWTSRELFQPGRRFLYVAQKQSWCFRLDVAPGKEGSPGKIYFFHYEDNEWFTINHDPVLGGNE